MNLDRFNTALPDEALSPNILLCAGEDVQVFFEAFLKSQHVNSPQKNSSEYFQQIAGLFDVSVDLEKVSAWVQLGLPLWRAFASHHYRGYTFFKLKQMPVTLVSCGIGEGNVEPLVMELAMYSNGIPTKVKRIISVGTAGAMHVTQRGVLWVKEAYYSGYDHGDVLSKPTVGTLAPLAQKYPQVRVCSTRTFYTHGSASNNPRTQASQFALAGVEAQWKRMNEEYRCDAIEMERGPLFELVNGLNRWRSEKSQPVIECVGLVGIANVAGEQATEETAVEDAIDAVVRAGLELAVA